IDAPMIRGRARARAAEATLPCTPAGTGKEEARQPEAERGGTFGLRVAGGRQGAAAVPRSLRMPRGEWGHAVVPNRSDRNSAGWFPGWDCGRVVPGAVTA